MKEKKETKIFSSQTIIEDMNKEREKQGKSPMKPATNCSGNSGKWKGL